MVGNHTTRKKIQIHLPQNVKSGAVKSKERGAVKRRTGFF
jgi:hypothetical protein